MAKPKALLADAFQLMDRSDRLIAAALRIVGQAKVIHERKATP